jgi:hypothetical protein
MFLTVLFLAAVALAVAILSRNLRQPSVVAITFGLLALVSLTVVGFISFTSFNPPDWFRIGSSVLLLVSLAGGIGAGVVGLRTPRRWWALLGIASAVIALVGLIVMFSIAEP